MDTIEKLVKILIQLNNEDALRKIQDVIGRLNTMDSASKTADKSMNQLATDLNKLGKTILPGLERAFSSVIDIQKRFIQTEENKIDVLKRLADQAKITGAAIKDSLSFSGVEFITSIKFAMAGLAAALPAALGAAIGGGAAVGGRTQVPATATVEKVEVGDIQPIEVPAKINEDQVKESILKLKDELKDMAPIELPTAVDKSATEQVNIQIEAYRQMLIDAKALLAVKQQVTKEAEKEAEIEREKARMLAEIEAKERAVTAEIQAQEKARGGEQAEAIYALFGGPKSESMLAGLPVPLEQLDQFLDKVLTDSEKLRAIWKQIKDTIPAALKSLNIKGALNSFSGAITSIFKGVFGDIWKIVGGGFKSLWADLGKINKAGIKGIADTFFSLKNLAIAGIAGYGLKQLAQSFLEVANAADQTRLRLSTLFHSAERGKKTFQDLLEYSTKTGYSIEELGRTTEVLATLQGTTQKDIENMYKAAADLSAITGMSVVDTAEQIQRMWSAGASAAQRFREKGVIEILGFSRKAEMSIVETRKRMLQVFGGEGTAPFVGLRGAAETMGKTWGRLVQIMINWWQRFQLAVMESGLFDYVKAALQVLINGFSSAGKGIENFGKTAQNVSQSVIGAIEWIVKAVAKIVDIWTLVKITVLSMYGVFTKIASFIDGIFKTVFGSVQNVLIKIIQFVRGLVEYIEQSEDILGLDIITGLAGNLHKLELAVAKADTSVEGFANVWDEAGKSAKEAALDATQSIGKAGDDADNFFKKVQEQIKKNTAAQEDYNKKLDETGKKIDENKKKLETSRTTAATPRAKFNVEVEQLGGLQQQRAITDDLKRQLETQKNIYEKYFAEGQAGLNSYYNERKALIEKATAEEAKLLEQSAKEVGLVNPEEAAKYYSELDALKRTSVEKMVELEQERATKEKEIFDAQYHWWQLGTDTKESYALQKEEELLEKERDIRLQGVEDRKTEELQVIQDQYDNALISLDIYLQQEIMSVEEAEAKKEEIRAFYENRIAKKREEQADAWITNARTTASTVEDAFANMYEASGKKIKAFAVLSKAAAIVNTMISTYEGAQKAYTALAGIPYVGPALGGIAAAVAIAGGLARIAVIRSQQLAEGGPVQGYSANDKSDNIPARLTAGEYVMPRSAVRYYGADRMEAIRRMAVSRDVFAGSSYPVMMGRGYFAAGGMVSASSAKEAKQQQQAPVIYNVVGYDVMDSYLQTKPGESSIINIINRNSGKVKGILAQ